jgi:hypothetical protein
MMAYLAAFLFAAGCFHARHQAGRAQSDGASTEQPPIQMPSQVYTGSVEQRTEEMGKEKKRSIKMPAKHYDWQKVAPCENGELEKVGGCWQELTKSRPPCPEYAVENEGTCLFPVPARPKTPTTLTPEKQQGESPGADDDRR